MSSCLCNRCIVGEVFDWSASTIMVASMKVFDWLSFTISVEDSEVSMELVNRVLKSMLMLFSDLFSSGFRIKPGESSFMFEFVAVDGEEISNSLNVLWLTASKLCATILNKKS